MRRREKGINEIHTLVGAHSFEPNCTVRPLIVRWRVDPLIALLFFGGGYQTLPYGALHVLRAGYRPAGKTIHLGADSTFLAHCPRVSGP